MCLNSNYRKEDKIRKVIKDTMKTIQLSNPVPIRSLKRKHNINDYTLVRTCIGYNDEVYFLFSGNDSKRIGEKNSNTQSNSKYMVIHAIVDWSEEELTQDECFDLGVHKTNHYLIQPIDDNILLLGARIGVLKNGSYENNAFIINTRGEILNAFCFGDGVEDCIVTKDSKIITSYFDEGVFADASSGEAALGNAGLVVWDITGQRIWQNEKYAIYDCYAINIDEQENLWFYYYDDFNLVQTDFRKDLIYHPEISGMNSFLLTKGNQILCDGGYNKHGQFCKMDILYDRLENMEIVNMEYNAQILLLKNYAFRSSKAIFVDNRDNLYFKDIQYI